jgi:hypothetical protein
MSTRTVTGIAAALALALLASPAQAGGYLYGDGYKDGYAPDYYARGASVRVYDAPPYYVPSYSAPSYGYESYYRYDHGGSYAYSYTYPVYEGYAYDCCCR